MKRYSKKKVYIVYCELEYYGRKRGLLRLLSDIASIEGVMVTKLDKNVITIKGEFDLDLLLIFVGKYVRIKCFRKGKCFSILYLPEPIKKENIGGNTDSGANGIPILTIIMVIMEHHYGGNGYQNYYTQPGIFGVISFCKKRIEKQNKSKNRCLCLISNSDGSPKKSKKRL